MPAATVALARQLIAEIREARELVRRVELVPEPVEWYQHVTGKHADPWQARFVASEAPASLLVAGRQVGKTEAVAARASHRARFWPRRVGILSPTLRQSSIVYRRCKALLVASGAEFARITLTELEMPHGGAIVAFPGDRPDLAVRGDTLDDLIIDEAGFIRDSLIAAASPTLATRPDATLTMLGTPAGQRGRFYEEWARGQGWERTKVRSEECPRISPAFLAREKRRLGPLYEQEYCGEFLAAVGSVFNAEDLEIMFRASGSDIELPIEDMDAPELVF